MFDPDYQDMQDRGRGYIQALDDDFYGANYEEPDDEEAEDDDP